MRSFVAYEHAREGDNVRGPCCLVYCSPRSRSEMRNSRKLGAPLRASLSLSSLFCWTLARAVSPTGGATAPWAHARSPPFTSLRPLTCPQPPADRHRAQTNGPESSWGPCDPVLGAQRTSTRARRSLFYLACIRESRIWAFGRREREREGGECRIWENGRRVFSSDEVWDEEAGARSRGAYPIG
jgi:hypothetical protein